MVIFRITLSVLLGLMLLINPVHARLSVSLDRDTLELGKSVVLTIRSDQPRPDLDGIALPGMKNTFHLESLATRARNGNAVQQRQWRLYPLRTGKLAIPSLHLGATRTQPVSMEVTSPVDPRSGKTFNINIEMPDEQVWLRESLYVRISLETSSPVVVLEREAIDRADMSITKLATRRERLDDNSERYRHTTGWVIQPRRHGQMTLELPSIDFVRDGITTHRFYMPPLKIQVRPLPAYLPPGIPVGEPQLQSQLARHWLFTDTLTYLKLRLSGKHMSPEDLPSLLDQFTGSKKLMMYPARTRQHSTTSRGNLLGAVDYEIPFKVRSAGIHTLPGIRLDYFDPRQGKIVTRNLPGITLYAMPRSLFYLLLAALVTGAWWLGRRYLLVPVPAPARRLCRLPDCSRLTIQGRSRRY